MYSFSKLLFLLFSKSWLSVFLAGPWYQQHSDVDNQWKRLKGAVSNLLPWVQPDPTRCWAAKPGTCKIQSDQAVINSTFVDQLIVHCTFWLLMKCSLLDISELSVIDSPSRSKSPSANDVKQDCRWDVPDQTSDKEPFDGGFYLYPVNEKEKQKRVNSIKD